MKIATVNSLHVAKSLPQWQAATTQLVEGAVERIDVPVAAPAELPALNQLLSSQVSAAAAAVAPQTGSGGVTLSLRFGDQAEAAHALSLLTPQVQKVARTHASLSIAQGAAGGAVIGAVGGAGVMALISALKSTTDSVGDPVLATLGAVLAGMAGGAVIGGGGAAVVDRVQRLDVDVKGSFVGISGSAKVGLKFAPGST